MVSALIWFSLRRIVHRDRRVIVRFSRWGQIGVVQCRFGLQISWCSRRKAENAAGAGLGRDDAILQFVWISRTYSHTRNF